MSWISFFPKIASKTFDQYFNPLYRHSLPSALYRFVWKLSKLDNSKVAILLQYAKSVVPGKLGKPAWKVPLIHPIGMRSSFSISTNPRPSCSISSFSLVCSTRKSYVRMPWSGRSNSISLWPTNKTNICCWTSGFYWAIRKIQCLVRKDIWKFPC